MVQAKTIHDLLYCFPGDFPSAMNLHFVEQAKQGVNIEAEYQLFGLGDWGI
jgi:hypothetical protein